MVTRFRFCLFTSAVLAAVLAGTSNSDGAPCVPKSPEGVLTCLEQVYSDRDLDGYAQLLAPDYEYIFGPRPAWLRDQELTSTREMFSSVDVTSVRLHLEITQEAALLKPDHWVFENVGSRLVIESRGPGDPVTHEVDSGATQRLSVRWTDELGYQIYRWEDTREDKHYNPGPEDE